MQAFMIPESSALFHFGPLETETSDESAQESEATSNTTMPHYFQREKEEKELQQYLEKPPADRKVLVLYGPQGSGKTCILRHMIGQGDSSSGRRVQGIFSMYLDLRDAGTDPSKLVSSIAEQLLKTAEHMEESLFTGCSCDKDLALEPLVGFIQRRFIRHRDEQAKSMQPDILEDVLEDYRAFLSELWSAKPFIEQSLGGSMYWPVLCIDHIEELKSWASGNTAQRKQLCSLLNFLKGLQVSTKPFCWLTSSPLCLLQHFNFQLA